LQKSLQIIPLSAKITKLFGADSGFDGISKVQGARRGAVGLVNKPQKNSRKRRTIRFSSLITCLKALSPQLPLVRRGVR